MQLNILGEDIECLRLGGSGRVILLLHGFGSDARSWLLNQPALGRTATVFAITLPGYGAIASRCDDFSIARLARIVNEVLPLIGGRRVHLVGHSLGGAIALHAAALAGQRVRALTLLAPAGLSETYDLTFASAFLAMTDAAGATAALSCLLAKPSLINRAMIDGVLAARSRAHTRHAWQATVSTLARAWEDRENARQILETLDIPVQIIWGSQDRVFPPDFRPVGDGEIVHVLPGIGHLPHMEASRDVNRLVAAFDDVHA